LALLHPLLYTLCAGSVCVEAVLCVQEVEESS
jgi:hypothetical protein